MKRFTLGLVFSVLSVSVSFAQNVLIGEIEALRNNLKIDDPARHPLTLRLGDLYFEEAMQASKLATPSEADLNQAHKNRSKSIQLYQEALRDGKGKLNSALRSKITFQLARLYSESAREADAKPLWVELSAQSENRELQQEATLRLAEMAEKRNDIKDAEALYRKVLGLCSGSDLCAYAHYRIGWMHYSTGNLATATTEMEQALFDSKGQIREEALRDYVMVLSHRPGVGEEELKKIEALVEKLSRPGLFQDMSNAFFSAGNKAAGVTLLAHAQTKQPTLSGKVKLLEEQYGLRQWDRFRETLTAVDSSAVGSEKLDGESEKVLRRLLVQLDGERVTKKEHADDFKAVSLVYLRHFPNHAERMKVMEGWIAAENDSKQRVTQLSRWLADASLGLKADEKLKLHQFRAANAEKLADWPQVESDMQALAGLATKGNANLEYQFKVAYALHKQGKNEVAVPKLRSLAQVDVAGNEWGVRAEQLAVEILGTQKDYPNLIAQAELWLSSSKVAAAAKQSAELRKFLDELKKVNEVAHFERAVSLGETPAALAAFKQFCAEKKYLPKSCVNTKILATKLRDQDSLLFALTALDEQGSLAEEFEASGLFAEAASTREKMAGGLKDSAEHLRVALLYELAQKEGDRNRVLQLLRLRLQKQKSVDVDEAILFETIKDAKLLSASWLDLAWSAAYKAKIASAMVGLGMGTQQVRKLLLDTPQEAGEGWSTVVLAEAAQLDEAQKKIDFYGKNSKKKFELRMAKLKQFAEFSDKYLNGANPSTRVSLLSRLSESHKEFARQIAESPIPPGLTAEEMAQVKASLMEIASPFEEKGAQYAKLHAEQSAQMAQQMPTTPPNATERKPLPVEAKLALKKDPENVNALTGLKDYYLSNGQVRLASYFEGRMKQLSNSGGKTE